MDTEDTCLLGPGHIEAVTTFTISPVTAVHGLVPVLAGASEVQGLVSAEQCVAPKANVLREGP